MAELKVAIETGTFPGEDGTEVTDHDRRALALGRTILRTFERGYGVKSIAPDALGGIRLVIDPPPE